MARTLKTAVKEVKRLACEFKSDVAARRALGDRNAEYHSQKPKNDAYKILLDLGLKPKEAVARFASIARKCR